MKTSSKTIFNLALSILWCLTASSKDVLATDDHVVYCNGIFSQNFCNCEEDCDLYPEHCECALAQECCSERSDRSFNLNDFVEDVENELGMIHDGNYGTILCPGQEPSEYCDCGGDCTGHPEFCACEEAIACCEASTPVVLCPGQPQENYCDCTGDCLMHPEWCQCEDAKKCCGEGESVPFVSRVDFLNAALAEAEENITDGIVVDEEDELILCPGYHSTHFCDCEADCLGDTETCSCGLAQDCCSRYIRKIRLRMSLLIVSPVILLLCWCLGYSLGRSL